VPAPAAPAATPVGGKTLPSLTWPQILAFLTFLTVCVLTAVSKKTLTTPEFDQVRKLAVFLIGALLPSDALIRFGRSLFTRAVEDSNSAQLASGANAPADFRPATLAQILAFLAFVVMVVLSLISNKIVDEHDFKNVNDVAVLLIAALLPSEAGIRFGRALYLRGATNVTQDHLKAI